MRDRDEKSVRIVGVKGRYGTPMTLVVGPDGVVRWHGFNGSQQSVKAVEETVSNLLEEYDAGEDAVARRLAAASKLRERGFTAKARALLEEGSKALAKAPDGKQLAARLSEWKAEAAFAKELELEKALEKALAPMADPGSKPGKIEAALEKLATKAAGTGLAARIERERARAASRTK